MRGTPFLKEGFSKGLNTIDSPYSIQDGETRDCLNVVSTLRGAIKKRTGSTVFASGSVATFADLAVTDSFERANEEPLSNLGKWTILPGEGSDGKIFADRWVGETHVQPLGKPSYTLGGGYWNVAEVNNPAASVKMSVLGTWVSVYACVAAGAERNGYSAESLVEEPSGLHIISLKKWVGGIATTLASAPGVSVAADDSLAITVRGGTLSAWAKKSGAWVLVLTASDNTYTRGFSGFAGKNSELNNFATAESTALSATAELVTLASVVVSSGTYMIASGRTNLFSINSGGEVSVIGSGFTSGARWSVVQAPEGTKKTGGPVYLCNGIDKPQYWSGAAKNTEVKPWVGEAGETFYEDATSKEHVPNGKYAIFAGNRVWMAGMSDDTSAVRFSAPSPIGEGGEQGDPTNWPKANVVRFDSSDKRPITGLGTIGPYVLAFKERKLWAIHNLDTGENRQLSSTVGTVSHRSIVETGIGTFFLTADQGVYLTNGSKVQEMSYTVRPTILAANPAVMANAAGTYFNNHYYLSFASGGSTVLNRTLDYDIILKSWWLHDLACNQWAISALSGATLLYGLPPRVGGGVVQCFVPEVFTDSGNVYTGNGTLAAWWISPWEPFAYYIFRHRIRAPFIKKRVRQIFFSGSGEIIPLVYKDFTEGGTQQPATVGNSESRSFPVSLTAGKQVFGNTDESQVFGAELYKGVQMIFGNATATAAARLYALGTGFVWGAGFGNNSSEPFEVDSFMYAISFRKS